MIEQHLQEGIAPGDYAGPLNVTGGITAWVGLIRVAQVQAGDAVVVSGATCSAICRTPYGMRGSLPKYSGSFGSTRFAIASYACSSSLESV